MSAATTTTVAEGRPLSFAQEQLWFLDQLVPGKTTYNIMLVWRLHGPLRVDLLQRSLTLVAARHESLRVTICPDEGTPYQVVAPAADVPLPVTDLRALPAAEREEQARLAIDRQRAEPFDLAAGPLCRFRLLRLDDEEYVFCQGFHHIITDGWSAAVINGELAAAYRSLHAGGRPAFPEREVDYTEFAESQRQRLRGEVLAGELAYWQRSLTGLPTLDLPADRPRPRGGSRRGETLIMELPTGLRDLAGQLGSNHGASMFMVLAAAFNLVLARYTGLDDIPTGVPMLGRPEPELEAVVGMFVNMVVLRSDLSGDPTFSELIERTADATLDLYEHQEVAFNQVVEAVAPARDPDRNPLFQVSIQLLGTSNSGEDLDLPEVRAEYQPLTSIESRFDIAVNLIDTGSALRANVEYAADMFDRWRMEALLGHLAAVLQAAAANPELRLSQIPIVTGAEEEALLAAGRAQPLPPDLAAEQVWVTDRGLNLAPRGVPGELLAGDAAAGLAGARRTGARVRWTADLRIEFLDQGDPAAAEDVPGPAGAGCDDLRTPTEERVADIFGQVLEVPAPGAEESFFQAGGNSLQAMRVVSRVNKTFGIKVSVRTMYGNPTVRAIAAAVDGLLGNDGD